MGTVLLCVVVGIFLLLVVLRLTAPKAPAKGAAQCPTCKLRYDPSIVECPVCGPEPRK